MPEDPECEASARILERFEGAVFRPRGLLQPITQAAIALVVMALDGCMVAEDLLDTGARLELDVVVGELTRSVFVLLVADDVREMLDEIAAQRDVQDLAPAA